jgi:PBP1b-binding outer membrane lipoprotein LpoB
MCKLLIILVLGILFSGCASSEASHSSQVSPRTQKIYQPISKAKPLNGCRALKNGYLVCPKIARR